MKNIDLFYEKYNELNEKQKEAVDTIDGPVMVIAGPGTGKTQIIGLRTANILRKTDVNPENILITTYSEAGVDAIKKRLKYFLFNDSYKVCVSTIHSFCQDVIINYPEKFIDYKTGNNIDEIDSIEILKEVIDEEIENNNIVSLVNISDRYFYLTEIKKKISILKQESISYYDLKIKIADLKNQYEEELSSINPKLKKYENTKCKQEEHILKLNELNYIYKRYNDKLKANSKYDFQDMINFVYEVLKKDDEIKYDYAEKFQYIMIDEFQDTNNSQNKIIDLILSIGIDSSNILVVGDDDQSIYRFQGANIENMLDFNNKYNDSKIIVLENNYRSNQNILDLCTELIKNNNQRITNRISNLEKKLISSHKKYKENPFIPKFYNAKNIEDEKTFLYTNVKNKINNGIPLNEIAIIVRNNKEVEDLSSFFIKNEINVKSKINSNILENIYVKFIIKFLKCLTNIDTEDENFINVVRSDIIGLNQIDIFKFNKHLFKKNYGRKYTINFYDEFCNIEKINNVEFDNLEDLIKFRDLFENLKKALHNKNIEDFFSYFLDKIGIINYIEKNGDFDDIEDIYTLFNKIKFYINTNKDFSIKNFLNKLELYSTYNKNIPRQILKSSLEGINILTAHSSKGLEFEVVFIPFLVNNNWDNKKVRDLIKLPEKIVGDGLQEKAEKDEEDRRLFFVACSRAKKELYLSFYSIKEDNKLLLCSKFIKEIDGFYEEIKQENSSENIYFNIKNQIIKTDIKYNGLEFEYIKEFLESYKISPTHLNIFIKDPINFLHQVVFKYPFSSNINMKFGNIYHKVMELFYIEYKKTGILKDKKFLIEKFKELLNKEFLTPTDYDALYEKGVKGLLGYYDIIKNKKNEILFLEYNFGTKGLFFNNIPITGKVDKIEILGKSETNGEMGYGQHAFFKEKIAIIDYKTGSKKSENNIKGLDKNGKKKKNEGDYFRQLMFYKLLFEKDNTLNNKYDIEELALDFIEGKNGQYEYLAIKYTEEDFQNFKNELIDSRVKITNIDFWKNTLLK